MDIKRLQFKALGRNTDAKIEILEYLGSHPDGVTFKQLRNLRKLQIMSLSTLYDIIRRLKESQLVQQKKTVGPPKYYLSKKGLTVFFNKKYYLCIVIKCK